MASISAVEELDRFDGFEIAIDQGVLTLSFNRPEVGNALPSAAIPQLGRLFRSLAERVDVRVLLIRGEGSSFCAGGDVKGFATTIDQAPDVRRADYFSRMDRACEQVEAFVDVRCPIVVACQGAVAGAAVAYPLGGDIVLAEPGTRFIFPHQRLGLPLDGGLSFLLPAVVGVRKATELALTSATIDAQEALRLGIVSRIVPAETLQGDALTVARKIANAPTGAVRRARDLIRKASSRSVRAQLEAERDAIADSVSEPDFEEGVRAFVEKRRAVFPSTL